MTIIGIDLGTTNSAVAYMKNGKPEIIENRSGGRITPSVVQIATKGDFAFGQTAKDGIVSLYDRTIIEVKRKMGTNERIKLGDKEYRPEEISALLLKELKKSAEEKLGMEIQEAVITVPAYFTDTQRKATQTAGELAGFKVERIINEPTAAAIAYGFDNMDKDTKLLVYDLGGGTFDVSVVEMFEGILEVKASAGNNHLGGSDFDQAIADWIVNSFKRDNGFDLLTLGTEDEIMQRKVRLKEEAEKAKKILSSQMSTRISIPFIAMHESKPFSVELELFRTEFEGLIKELALSTLKEIDKALGDAGLRVNEINEVLLVGGSTRIPYIHEIVKDKFNKQPKKDINPDEAVALGAAVQAGIKSGEISSVNGIMVTDVCPFTLGTELMKTVGGQLTGGHFDPIIQRNMTIPSSRTKTYYTAIDNQESVVIKAYQGDNSYVSNNHYLGETELKGIPRAPAGTEAVEVTFHYDINGGLQITAKSVSTGRKISTTITRFGIMNEKEIVASREALDQQWEQSELFNEVKAVIYRAEKVMEQANDLDRQRIQSVMEKLKQALSRNDKNQVVKYEEELTDLLIELV